MDSIQVFPWIESLFNPKCSIETRRGSLSVYPGCKRFHWINYIEAAYDSTKRSCISPCYLCDKCHAIAFKYIRTDSSYNVKELVETAQLEEERLVRLVSCLATFRVLRQSNIQSTIVSLVFSVRDN